MSEETEAPMSAIFVVGLTLIIAFIGAYLSNVLSFFKNLFQEEKLQQPLKEETNANGQLNNGDLVQKDKQTKKKQQEKTTTKTPKFSHAWLAVSLKSHTGIILDISFSANGKYLATCGDDRSAYVWVMKECLNNNPKSVRMNIEFDHASKICFSPDNKAFVASLHHARTIRVYKLSRKEDGGLGKITPASEFPEENFKHSEDVNILQISSNGAYIAACLKDTTKLWDLKGNLLATVETPELKHACLSPCSRFLAVSGFTSQVTVWEVKFDKTAKFAGVSKAYYLDGHRAAVPSFAYSADSKRMVTLSKDRTWRLWDVDIDFKRGQVTKELRSWSCESIIMTGTSSPAHIAFSTNGLSVSVGKGDRVFMYNVFKEEPEVIEDLMIGEVVSMMYSPDDLYLIIAGHKTVLLLHNVQGLKALLDDLYEKHPKTNLMKDRIDSMIKDTKQKIQSFAK